MSEALVCWQCGASLAEVPLPVSRHANCPQCFTELHCCRLCLDFDPGVAEQCREDRADTPSNKEGVNFCEFFRPRLGAFQAPEGSQADSARNQLDALFGASDSSESTEPELEPEPGNEDEARAKLDALFGAKPADSD